jgi:hypothetical protein
MTFTRQDAYRYIGHHLYDADRHKIGKIRRAVRDSRGSLGWVTVITGHVGGKEKFVPIADAKSADEGLAVPFSKEKVEAAPAIEPAGSNLSADEEAVLQAYYADAAPPPPVEKAETVDPDRRRVRPRSHETTFGTGGPRPGEPDDITLQGTGTSAPRKPY